MVHWLAETPNRSLSHLRHTAPGRFARGFLWMADAVPIAAGGLTDSAGGLL
jgi:hypothetical protein